MMAGKPFKDWTAEELKDGLMACISAKDEFGAVPNDVRTTFAKRILLFPIDGKLINELHEDEIKVFVHRLLPNEAKDDVFTVRFITKRLLELKENASIVSDGDPSEDKENEPPKAASTQSVSKSTKSVSKSKKAAQKKPSSVGGIDNDDTDKRLADQTANQLATAAATTAAAPPSSTSSSSRFSSEMLVFSRYDEFQVPEFSSKQLEPSPRKSPVFWDGKTRHPRREELRKQREYLQETLDLPPNFELEQLRERLEQQKEQLEKQEEVIEKIGQKLK